MATTRKTIVTYPCDGIQKNFTFPFDYLKRSFIKVRTVEGIGKVYGIDYTVTGKQAEFSVAPPLGTVLVIYRETATDRLVVWEDASVLRASDMTLFEMQVLHVAEETQDKVQDSGLALDITDNKWDARLKPLKNMGDPVENLDAVNVRFLNNMGLFQARDLASQKASEASISASNAFTSEGKAKVSETNAKASEDKAKVSETNAKASENVSVTKASDATTQANRATTEADRSYGEAERAKGYASNVNNAQTLEGKRASEFATTIHGHQGIKAYKNHINGDISQADLPSILMNIDAVLGGGMRTDFMSDCTAFGTADYATVITIGAFYHYGVSQIATPYNNGGTPVMAVRLSYMYANCWSPWKVLATTDGNVATATAFSDGKKSDDFFQYDGVQRDADTMLSNRSGFNHATNAPFIGPIVHFDAVGYGLQFNCQYHGSIPLAYRTRNRNSLTWNDWKHVATTDQLPTQGTRVWVSGDYTPVVNTPTIVAHGLTIDPLKAKGDVLLRCVAADGTYSVGDYAMSPLNYGGTDLSHPAVPTLTATHIQINTGGSSGGLYALNKNNGVSMLLTPSKWRYVFRIFY